MTPQQTEKDLPVDTPSEGDAQPVDPYAHLVFCGCCLWWVGDADAADGKCYRHAPRPTAIGGGVVWPTTTRSDFCGEAELNTVLLKHGI